MPESAAPAAIPPLPKVVWERKTLTFTTRGRAVVLNGATFSDVRCHDLSVTVLTKLPEAASHHRADRHSASAAPEACTR